MAQTDPHKPLRDDVRMLGELLGDTLQAHAGRALFERVERVRALAKSGRSGNEDDFRVLADELGGMTVDESLLVSRAFTHFLHLANIAEQHHRTRRRRQYRMDPGAPPQRGSCEDGFARLIADGVSPGTSTPHHVDGYSTMALDDLVVQLVTDELAARA